MPSQRKHTCPPPGAPDWVVTYGDLMGLLLTFFLLLLSMSELRKTEDYDALVKQVQKSFGMTSGGGTIASEEQPANSMVKLLDMLSFRSNTVKQRSTSQDPGIEGRESQVTRVREGMIFTKGGRITFEPGSAELTEDAKQRILSVVHEIKGYNNVLEIRGHAASMEATVESPYADLWELSHARAKAVMNFLTSREVGIPASRIRVIAQADHAPVVNRVYSTQAQEPNRRVELFQTEALADEFRKPDAR
jgi:chemotaxis protein MotB